MSAASGPAVPDSYECSGSSMTPRTTLKMADVAPMPSASAITAGIVKRGERRNERTAKRRSWNNIGIWTLASAQKVAPHSRAWAVQ